MSFQFEPPAAALDYEQRIDHELLVLQVDIGGGTSDFTVVRLGPQCRASAQRGHDVLATTGCAYRRHRSDRRLSLDLLMPLLGFRQRPGREVPNRVFFDLSTCTDSWLYLAARIARCAQNLRTDYADPRGCTRGSCRC